ncbi:MAG: hypothetical protein WB014_08270 [Methanosarcina sp.]
MARGAELAVLASAGDLAKHIFVKVALGITVFHGHAVQKVNCLGQHRGRGNGEAGTFHVLSVGRIVASEGAQEREDVLVDNCEHLGRCEVFEVRPAQIFIWAALWVVSFKENAALHRTFEACGFVLFKRVQVIQSP